MARARNIKPSLFKNELLGVADPLLTILFTSLWCLADKRGRLEDRPLRIKAETFPYREIAPDTFNGYLTELSRLGFIHRFEVNGNAIIQVVHFEKHQSPHHTEKESELPCEPDKQGITVISPLENGENPSHNALIPDSLLLIPDTFRPDDVQFEEPLTTFKGRNGIPRTMTPINPSLDLELKTWLSAVAGACGAKSASTLPKLAKWEQVCMSAIREQRDLTALLKIIADEKTRLGTDTQFFSPDVCLQKLQMTATAKQSKWTHNV